MGNSTTQASSATTPSTFNTRNGRTLEFSAMGFGAAELGNYRRELEETECDAVVAAAWQSGLRYFDTAPLYGLGLSEARLGRGLRAYPRDGYLLATKVGRVLEACPPGEENGGFFVATPPGIKWRYDYSYDGILRSVEASLERLGLDRVDILYVHDVDGFNHTGPDRFEAPIRELIELGGWRALEELRAANVVSAIGAGVNQWQPCARLLELADPDLFLLAGRYTLLEQEPLTELFPQCLDRDVGVVIGGPYNSGILAGGSTYNYADAPPAIARQVAKLDAVCRAHDVPMAAAALQFAAAHPGVVSVIPGMQTVAEIRQNVALFDAALPSAFWAELKASGLLAESAPVPGTNGGQS